MSMPAEFGPYTLLRALSSSDETRPFLARPRENPGVVLLRVLPPGNEEKGAQRLRHAARLNHVNIAPTLDGAQWEGVSYAVEEHVTGISLADLLLASRGQAALPAEVACFIASEICAGLTYAHTRREPSGAPLEISHGHLDPARVLVTAAGDVRVVGFASPVPDQAPTDPLRASCIPPERTDGSPPDQAADIFAAAAIAFRMLAGEPAQPAAADAGEGAAQHASVPEELAPLLQRGLAARPEDRLRTAAELRSGLAAWLRRNAPGFGRHRLRVWLAALPSPPSPDAADGAAIGRRDFAVVDPCSIIQDHAGQPDAPREAILDLLKGPHTPTGSTRPAAPPPTPGAQRSPSASAPRAPAPSPPGSAGTEPAPATADDSPNPLDEILVSRPIGDDAGTDILSAARLLESPAAPEEPYEAPPASTTAAEGSPTVEVAPLEPPSPSAAPADAPQASSLDRAGREAAALSADDLATATYDDSVSVDPAFESAAVELERPEPGIRVPGRNTGLKVFLTAAAVLAFSLAIAHVVFDVSPDRFLPRAAAVDERPAGLWVESNPLNASIVVDGRDTGLRTPALVPSLPPGPATVTVTHPGFEAAEAQNVTLEAGRQATARFFLTPEPHTLRVDSDPPGATVLHEGTAHGPTPTRIGPLQLAPGTTVRLIVRAEGYLDEYIETRWEAGQGQSTVRASLRPDPRYVPPEVEDELQ